MVCWQKKLGLEPWIHQVIVAKVCYKALVCFRLHGIIIHGYIGWYGPQMDDWMTMKLEYQTGDAIHLHDYSREGHSGGPAFGPRIGITEALHFDGPSMEPHRSAKDADPMTEGLDQTLEHPRP